MENRRREEAKEEGDKTRKEGGTEVGEMELAPSPQEINPLAFLLTPHSASQGFNLLLFTARHFGGNVYICLYFFTSYLFLNWLQSGFCTLLSTKADLSS